MIDHWLISHPNQELQQTLSKALNIQPLTAQLLINRGVTSVDHARQFITPHLNKLPDPFAMPQMKTAVERIIRAIHNEESIAIYGDYDVDGITSTALLVRFFDEIGIKVLSFIPHRTRDGYGMSKRGIDELKKQQVSLIITVDNGMRSQNEINYAHEVGLEVIVTDHHEPDGELQNVIAALNPKLCEANSAFQNLSGCGVAFMLLMALRKQLREENLLSKPEPNLKSYLEFVALANIADVVPLTGTNRVLTLFGLDEIRKNPSLGIAALLEVSKVQSHQINTGTVSFRLAPRLNAAGRIDCASTAVKLLLAKTSDEAFYFAEELERLNKKRQGDEAEVVKEALKDPIHSTTCGATVSYAAHWHVGVIGIAAAKMVARYKRPAAVIGGTGDEAKGSIRTYRNIDVLAALESCADLLLRFGGHTQAAGLSIHPENIKKFRERFNEYCEKKLNQLPDAQLQIDALLEPEKITEDVVHEIESLAPFGAGNPEPLFCTHQLRTSAHKVVGERHLKFKVLGNKRHFDAIAFNMADPDMKNDDSCSIAFCPQFNEWRGIKNIQLKIKALVPAAGSC